MLREKQTTCGLFLAMPSRSKVGQDLWIAKNRSVSHVALASASVLWIIYLRY